MYYTGIGPRNTPRAILNLMTEIGMYFAMHKWVLRSGGAEGADTAFEQGHVAMGGDVEIYLPFKGFRHHSSSLYMGGPDVENGRALSMAEYLWEKRTGNNDSWRKLSSCKKAAMARTMLFVLGARMITPTDVVICWTSEEEPSGGTELALLAADEISKVSNVQIPIINLQRESHRIAIGNMLKGTDPGVVVRLLRGDHGFKSKEKAGCLSSF